MKNIKLANEYLKVEIKHDGAELTSIKRNKFEYLWQGNPEFWGRRSPVLFPIVGSLKDGQYKVNEQVFKLPQHGFLRDRIFSLVDSTKTTACFRYETTEADLALYPYKCAVEIRYELVDDQVSTIYYVENLDEELYFSIGGHPAYTLEQPKENYQLIFQDQLVDSFTFKDSLLNAVSREHLSIIDYSQMLVDRGTMCYTGLSEKKVLVVENGMPYIEMKFDDFDYFAIWSPENKAAPFICLEPWNGVNDVRSRQNYDLDKKLGIRYLAKDQTATYKYTTKFFEKI
ncbi:MAG: aldose 1-epimerase family protein [Mycoplasmatales bacterium]